MTTGFNGPYGLAVDSNGNVFVGQSGAISKITPDGGVRTMAGVASQPLADGVGTMVGLGTPASVALDGNGNLLMSDGNHNVIRKISPAGVVSTIAGAASPGFVNGTGLAASLHNPQGLAVDSSGTIYVADSINHAIRKITPDGVVSTLAGSGSAGFVNGTGTAASFNYPQGVAVDASGTVYVTDRVNNAIRKITPAGVVSTLAGSGSAGFVNGTGASASFSDPQGIAVDVNGNLYVADGGNNAIRKISPTGAVTTVAGSGAMGFVDGAGNAAQFRAPNGVALDNNGNLFVADSYNNAIRKISPGGLVSTVTGDGPLTHLVGPRPGLITVPLGLAVGTNGNIYVADEHNDVIWVVLQ